MFNLIICIKNQYSLTCTVFKLVHTYIDIQILKNLIIPVKVIILACLLVENQCCYTKRIKTLPVKNMEHLIVLIWMVNFWFPCIFYLFFFCNLGKYISNQVVHEYDIVLLNLRLLFIFKLLRQLVCYKGELHYLGGFNCKYKHI